MGNRADEEGTDVEIYRRPLTDTIHADTPTGAPAELHNLLDQLGLERHEERTGGPLYTWHMVPAHLAVEEQKRLASRAIPILLLAGYEVSCANDVFDEAAYQQGVRDIRTAANRPAAPRPAPGSDFPTAHRTASRHAS
ncbi:hypothetical protein [Streptomyces sp. SID1121]|uniref:hypothetical protein n=1 Tax=Streptomyces sp. SID1121 TaxID=3425888 RepID=UPI0040579885